MNLNTKAAVIVGLVTFLQSDHACCRMLESVGVGKVVRMRDEKGALSREGQIVMSLFFALLTYGILSMRK
jgi:hypothetical protein